MGEWKLESLDDVIFRVFRVSSTMPKMETICDLPDKNPRLEHPKGRVNETLSEYLTPINCF